MAKDWYSWSGSKIGMLIGALFGLPITGATIGNIMGASGKTPFDLDAPSDDEAHSWISDKWDDYTGKTNTEIQNSAAATLQEDAQQHQIDMLGYQTAASLDYAEKLPSAQMKGLQAAGLNPALAAGSPYSSSVSASSAGMASPQASNVSAIQSVANAAITAGMLIKIMKAMSKY